MMSHGRTAAIFGLPEGQASVKGLAGLSRRALLHNLRYDEPVAAFANASGVGTNDEASLGGQPRGSAGGGACTAISFRTGAFLLGNPDCRWPIVHFEVFAKPLSNLLLGSITSTSHLAQPKIRGYRLTVFAQNSHT